MRAQDDPSHRFAALDGWRGICAVLVALFHLQINSHFATLAIVRNAWLFVDFFFVLSGFVIAHAYGTRLSSAAQAWTFALRRFARLWPLHVALLAAFIGLELYRFAVTGSGFTGARSVPAIFTNLLLIQSLGMHDGLTWNTPAWSISTEFYTYLVFAVVCIAGTGKRSRTALSVALAALGIGVLLLFSRYGMRETFGWGFFRCLYGFFVGVLTYELWLTLQNSLRPGSVLEIGAVIALGFFLIVVPGHHALEYLAPLCFAAVVLLFAQEGGIASHILRTRVVAALGRWSYSIYMVHILIVALLFSALDSIGGWTRMLPSGSETIVLASRTNSDVLTLVYLAAVIAFAAFTWRVIELPGQRFFANRRPREVHAVAAEGSAGF